MAPSSSTSREFRLSSTIGLALIIPLLLFTASMLAWSFQTTRHALEQEMNFALAQRHNLASHIISNSFQELERTVEKLADDDLLRILSGSDPIPYLEDYLVELSMELEYPPDLLFFGLPATGIWYDASSPFYHSITILDSIKSLQADLRLQSRVLRLGTAAGEITLMATARPVLQKETGEVAGVLVGCTVLNDNIPLLEDVRSHTQAAHCSLYSGEQCIISTDRRPGPIGTALDSIMAGYPLSPDMDGKGTRIGQGMVASIRAVGINTLPTPLTLAIVVEDKVYQDTQKQFLGQLGMVLAFFIAFLAFTILAIRKLTFSPLKRLLTYSFRASSEDENASYAPGSIKEFNQLGMAMNDMVNKLGTSRAFVRNIIDSMPSMLAGIDDEGCVTHWNNHAEQMTSIPQEKALGRQITELMPEMAGEEEQFDLAISSGKPVTLHKDRHVDSSDIQYIDITIYPLTLPGTRGAVLRVDDVTERMQIEEMVIQSEKMLSIGGLAAGMAHEINNPLAAILGNAQIMRNRLSPDLKKNRTVAGECGTSIEAIHTYINKRGVSSMMEAILQAGKRAAEIVSNMLDFSRRSDTNKHPVDVADLLDRTLDLVSTGYNINPSLHFKDIDIVRHYDPNASMAFCEHGRIQQVFLNILKNGAEAMAEKEYLDDQPRFTLAVGNDGPFVRIDIEDNGPGMDKDTQRRIFEPFFTTKEVGLGTGLGLSVSYFIITEGEKGRLAVHSTPGKWTRFTIHLPLRNP